jgi:hypothetical protein
MLSSFASAGLISFSYFSLNRVAIFFFAFSTVPGLAFAVYRFVG